MAIPRSALWDFENQRFDNSKIYSTVYGGNKAFGAGVQKSSVKVQVLSNLTVFQKLAIFRVTTHCQEKNTDSHVMFESRPNHVMLIGKVDIRFGGTLNMHIVCQYICMYDCTIHRYRATI
jgi:hypothetical protein